MLVKDVMTRSFTTITPDKTLRAAARLMAGQDWAILPVVQKERLVGMITDRDITLRGIAESKDPDRCTVEEIMTHEIKYLFEDETLKDLARNMNDLHIRRLPVINRKRELVGIVSLKDLTAQSDRHDAGAALQFPLRSVASRDPHKIL